MELTRPPVYAAVAAALLLGACATGSPATGSQAPNSSGQGPDRRSGQASVTEAPSVPAREAVLKGDTALGNGDLDRALFFYVEALKADPSQSLTLIKVGTIHWQRGDLQRSLEAFRRALAIEPANALAVEGEGLALLDLGDRSGARVSLERAWRWMVRAGERCKVLAS